MSNTDFGNAFFGSALSFGDGTDPFGSSGSDDGSASLFGSSSPFATGEELALGGEGLGFSFDGTDGDSSPLTTGAGDGESPFGAPFFDFGNPEDPLQGLFAQAPPLMSGTGSEPFTSSNHDPLGNDNPLSLSDERLLRLGMDDLRLQSDETLVTLREDFDRIGRVSELRDGESDRGLERAANGIADVVDAVPIEGLLKKVPLVGPLLVPLGRQAKSEVLERVQGHLSETLAPDTLDPDIAFGEIDGAVTELSGRTTELGELRFEAERILQRRDGPLSDEDRARLTEIRAEFETHYGSDLQSGAGIHVLDAARTAYDGQHWRLVNYHSAQHQIAKVDLTTVERQLDFYETRYEQTGDPQMKQYADSLRYQVTYTREGVDVTDARYGDVVNRSETTKDAMEALENEHYQTMSLVADTWADINAALA